MNKISYASLAVLLAAGIILSACSASTPAPVSLSGTSWKLVSYGDKINQTPAAAGIDTSLVFGSDGQMEGNMGCNSFGGPYTVKDGTLTIGNVVSTMMACQEPRMTQESSAFQVLQGEVSFTLNGDTLVIVSSGGTQALTLSRAAKP